VIDADLVIADLSKWNANAFYELGLRHMAEGPVIHMIDRSNQDIPFDVKPYRTILFGWTSHKELEQSKDDLRAQVHAVLDESHTVDNPVTRARGQINLRKTASPREQEMLSMMEDLRSQMAKMQHDIVSLSTGAARELASMRGDALVAALRGVADRGAGDGRQPNQMAISFDRPYGAYLTHHHPATTRSSTPFPIRSHPKARKSKSATDPIPPKWLHGYGAEMRLLEWRARLVCSQSGGQQVDMVVSGRAAIALNLPTLGQRGKF
jgi:hypothetical protein